MSSGTFEQQNILFAAGGTGGHVIPAYVLASAIKKQHPRCEMVFIGAKGKFEETWIPSQGFRIELFKPMGIKSGSLFKRLMGLLRIPFSFFKAWCILCRYKPKRMFGIGGYVSGPIMLLASLKGIPTAILEPNAVAGFSNRILGKFVKRVYTVFPSVNDSFPSHKVRCFGHLLRDDMYQISPPVWVSPKRTVTLVGGSQGSMRVNKAFLEMLGTYKDNLMQDINIIHQTGAKDFDAVTKAYEDLGIGAVVKPFFEDMTSVYAKTHILIARSGSSVIEFATIGIPSILIPLSIAADNHQYENAKELVDTGGAVMIEERDLDPKALYEALMKLLNQDLSVMSRRLRSLRNEHATEHIMNDFVTL